MELAKEGSRQAQGRRASPHGRGDTESLVAVGTVGRGETCVYVVRVS